jgi:hypothetical protein
MRQLILRVAPKGRMDNLTLLIPAGASLIELRALLVPYRIIHKNSVQNAEKIQFDQNLRLGGTIEVDSGTRRLNGLS